MAATGSRALGAGLPALAHIATMAAQRFLTYRVVPIANLLIVMMQIYALAVFGRAVYAGRETVRGVDIETLLTYLALANLRVRLARPVLAWAIQERVGKGEVAFLYALRMTVRGVYSVFLYGEMHRVTGVSIVQGEFGRYLVRPMPPLAQIMAGYFWVGSLAELVAGVALLGAAGTLAAIDWSAPALAELAPAVGLAWLTLACRFWRAEMRHYQSAGH